MPTFAGFDTSAYPGDENMAHIKAHSNLSFVGFYLAPAPAHPHHDWMGARAELVKQGWGLAPIFVGQQLVGPGMNVAAVNPLQGTEDGVLAGALMARAGFPAKSWVYLDLENGTPLTLAQRSYVQAWCGAVHRAGFKAGVYCSHTLAELVSNSVPGARIWAVRVKSVVEHDASGYGGDFPLVDPHASGYQYSYLWQHEQNAKVDIAGLFLDVDLNVSVLRDPSR